MPVRRLRLIDSIIRQFLAMTPTVENAKNDRFGALIRRMGSAHDLIYGFRKWLSGWFDRLLGWTLLGSMVYAAPNLAAQYVRIVAL
jgi:hypothetical protein